MFLELEAVGLSSIHMSGDVNEVMPIIDCCERDVLSGLGSMLVMGWECSSICGGQ